MRTGTDPYPLATSSHALTAFVQDGGASDERLPIPQSAERVEMMSVRELLALPEHPENSRTFYPELNAESEVELRASIVRHGLIENIVLAPLPSGKGPGILCGNRRTRNIRKLVEDEIMTLDYRVPVSHRANSDDDDGVSFHENYGRLDMKAWETYERIRRMSDKGMDARQIGIDLGVGEREVARLLRLSRLSRTIMKALSRGEITVEAAHAYAVTSDVKRQKAVYDSLGKEASATRIQQALRAERVGQDHKHVTFVGLDAYLERGGRTEPELLTDRVNLLDVELLQTLVAEKLAAEAAKLEGWKWVESGAELSAYTFAHGGRRIEESYSDPDPELVARRDAFDEQLQALDDWLTAHESAEAASSEYEVKEAEYARLDGERDRIDDLVRASSREQDPLGKPFSGCVVTLSYHGDLEVSTGLLRTKGDIKGYEAACKARDKGGDVQKAIDAAAAPAKRKVTDRSASFEKDLGLYRRAAEQATLATNPKMARLIAEYDMVCESFARGTLPSPRGGDYHTPSGYLHARGQHVSNRRERDGDERCDAEKELVALEKKLDLSWRNRSPAAQFAAYAALSPKKRDALFAWAVASRLLVGVTPKGAGSMPEPMREGIGTEHARWWRPSEQTYFGRCTTAQLIAHGVEWYGKGFADEVARMKGAKKAALVARFQALFHGPEKDLTEAEREIRATWLPVELR